MSPDFKDLLSTFNAHRVDYLVVGAHALAAHGHIRATGDLEVWVRPDVDNARRVADFMVRVFELQQAHGLSVWDALIVQAASERVAGRRIATKTSRAIR